MNTGLGLSFWRIVNEEGSNGWAQIYARIPYDDQELQNKGALFGVVLGEKRDDWAEIDAELMGWVEEYFNKLDSLGDLSDFGNSWQKKYPDMTGVWVWINVRDGKREIRITRWGEGVVTLVRQEKEFDFSKNLIPGKVVKGVVEEGDKLVICSGIFPEQMSDKLPKSTEVDISQWSKELVDMGNAAAGLIFNFGKLMEVGMEDKDFEVVENSNFKVTVPVAELGSEIKDIEEDFSGNVKEDSEMTENRPSFDLAQDRLVGPLGFKEKLINKWIGFRQVKQKGLVDRKENVKRKKWSMLLGLIFLVLLLVSLITGSIKIKQTAELKKWQSFSDPIEKSLQEAGNLISINPSGAKKLIEDVKAEFSSGRSQFESGKYKKDLLDLEKKINDGWTSASGEKESEVDEILRIDLVRQGFKGERLGLIKGSQFQSLDSLMGVVVTADSKTKDIKVVAGKGEGLGWVDVAGEASKPMMLSSGGVRDALTGADLIKFDAAVAKPVAIGKFGSNLYVLDQGNKEIYKYAGVADGFGDRTRWLKQDQVISFEPVDMAMDTDIWIVASNGQVDRFRRGAKEQFSLSGLPVNLKVKRIAVDQNGTKLALLDSTSGNVIVCLKDTGVCNQVLKSGRFIGAGDIEFDEQGQLLVLYAGTVGVVR